MTKQAGIELSEHTWVQGIWFVTGPAKDWLATLYRDVDGDNPRWHFVYRFRYYADERVFNGADRKVWYEHTQPIDADGDELEIGIHAAALTVAESFQNNEIHFVPFKCLGSDPKLIDFMSNGNAPWMHYRPVMQTLPGENN